MYALTIMLAPLSLAGLLGLLGVRRVVAGLVRGELLLRLIEQASRGVGRLADERFGLVDHDAGDILRLVQRRHGDTARLAHQRLGLVDQTPGHALRLVHGAPRDAFGLA